MWQSSRANDLLLLGEIAWMNAFELSFHFTAAAYSFPIFLP